MNSTNAIEKALQQKIAEEIRSEVKAFVSNIEQSLRDHTIIVVSTIFLEQIVIKDRLHTMARMETTM